MADTRTAKCSASKLLARRTLFLLALRQDMATFATLRLEMVTVVQR